MIRIINLIRKMLSSPIQVGETGVVFFRLNPSNIFLLSYTKYINPCTSAGLIKWRDKIVNLRALNQKGENIQFHTICRALILLKFFKTCGILFYCFYCKIWLYKATT